MKKILQLLCPPFLDPDMNRGYNSAKKTAFKIFFFCARP